MSKTSMKLINAHKGAKYIKGYGPCSSCKYSRRNIKSIFDGLRVCKNTTSGFFGERMLYGSCGNYDASL